MSARLGLHTHKGLSLHVWFSPLQDTLTDMSFSPKYIPISGRNETYVHGVSLLNLSVVVRIVQR